MSARQKHDASSDAVRQEERRPNVAKPPALTALDSSASAFSPLDALLHRVVFSRPLRLMEPTGWVPHIPFAFWLVAASRPRTFVELGTHSGNSYSAFVQASQALGLDTSCHAVDTWKGDQHAGFYGEEVFEEWSAFHDRSFSACSRLIRSSFDDAVERFPDASIDLLHIDGLHTYDAVRHDFETWLPKLSDSSVVILHDTNVREGDFGVWKLWEELERKYPCFEFLHGYGLGIVGVGQALPAELKWLLEDVPADRQRVFIVRELFTALGEALLLQHEKTGQDQERAVLTERIASHAESLAKLQAELDAALETVRTVREDRAPAVARLRSELANRDVALERLRGARDESAAEVARLRDELANRAATIERIQTERDKSAAEVARLRDELAERAATIERIQTERDESARKIRDLTRRLEEQHAEVNRRTEFLVQTYTKGRLRRWMRTAGTLLSWLLRPPFRRRWLQFTEYLAIRHSRSFDSVYYLHNNLDVLAANISPLIHYVGNGVREGRNPHPHFNTKEYLKAHPELAASGRNPFLHFLVKREQEPSPDALDRPDPFHNDSHVLAQIRSSGLFDPAYYRQRYESAISTPNDLLMNFLNSDPREMRDPGPLFSTAHYLTMYADVAASQMNPLVHYVLHGACEGRIAFPPEKVQAFLSTVETDNLRSLFEIVPPDSKVNVLCAASGNFFFSEIAQYVADLLTEQGCSAKTYPDLPDDADPLDQTIVIAPHEFFVIGPGKDWPADKAAQAIPFNTEQWQTPWFAKCLPHLWRSAHGVLDMNPNSAAGLNALGIRTAFLPLLPIKGSVFEQRKAAIRPTLVKRKHLKELTYPEEVAARPYDLAYVAVSTPRRATALATLAKTMAPYSCFIHSPRFDRPIVPRDGDVLSGGDLTQIAMNSKILLNIHRDDVGYLEWHRLFLYGVMNGCVVLTEPCFANALISPDEHYLQAPLGEMPDLIHHLLTTTDGRQMLRAIHRNNLKLRRSIELGNRLLQP